VQIEDAPGGEKTKKKYNIFSSICWIRAIIAADLGSNTINGHLMSIFRKFCTYSFF